MYKRIYKSPIGEICLNSDGKYLTALCFNNSKSSNRHIKEAIDKDIPVFGGTIKWLDIYFSGKIPDFIPKYKINNITPFRQDVLDEMLKIPYGKTVTYNDIAKSIAKKRKLVSMSAQAVGGAVGWNPIGIIIPCHRVVGKNKSLTGYSGGMNNKIKLLELEGVNVSEFTVPKEDNNE